MSKTNRRNNKKKEKNIISMSREEWEYARFYHMIKANNLSQIRFLRALRESKQNQTLVNRIALDITEIKEMLTLEI